MKPKVVSRAAVVAVALIALSAANARTAETVRYGAVPNVSKVRIEGTSTVHDWTVEGSSIGGFMELPADFPLDPAKPLPATLSATPKVEANIFVRTLHNLKKYEGMDDIMNGKLLYETHPRILYRLTELKPAKADSGKVIFNAKGDLVVAGVTNNIAMPVAFEKQSDNKLKVTGEVKVKMTDFKIEPPAPAVALGIIKTGDEVKLSFEWVTRPAPAAK